jgi:hypothetical protein
MRVFFASAIFVLAVARIAFSQDIQHTDFKNFSYVWSGPPNWSNRVKWLDPTVHKRVHLTDGRWRDANGAPESDEFYKRAGVVPPFAGLTLESVTFGDVTGEGRDDALVVLRYDTGGTQFSYLVYIFSYRLGRPYLLGYFHAGDRAYSGLYQVYPQDKQLIVELFDPQKRSGDCCSSGFLRTRYRWRLGKFEAAGPREFGTPKAASRIPVSRFGLHQ